VQFEAVPVAAEGVGENDFRAGLDETAVQAQDLAGLIDVPEFRRFARAQPGQHVIGAGGAIGQHHGAGFKEFGQ